MENKEHQKQIIGLLSKKSNDYGLSLSDMRRCLSLSKDQIRITIAFLLGARKIKENKFGMSKIYFIPRNKFMDEDD